MAEEEADEREEEKEEEEEEELTRVGFAVAAIRFTAIRNMRCQTAHTPKQQTERRRTKIQT